MLIRSDAQKRPSARLHTCRARRQSAVQSQLKKAAMVLKLFSSSDAQRAMDLQAAFLQRLNTAQTQSAFLSKKNRQKQRAVLRAGTTTWHLTALQKKQGLSQSPLTAMHTVTKSAQKLLQM